MRTTEASMSGIPYQDIPVSGSLGPEPENPGALRLAKSLNSGVLARAGMSRHIGVLDVPPWTVKMRPCRATATTRRPESPDEDAIASVRRFTPFPDDVL